MKSPFLYKVRRFLWMCTVGFMIAWHNVYFQDDRLREEDRIEQEVLEEDQEKDASDFPLTISSDQKSDS